MEDRIGQATAFLDQAAAALRSESVKRTPQKDFCGIVSTVRCCYAGDDTTNRYVKYFCFLSLQRRSFAASARALVSSVVQQM